MVSRKSFHKADDGRALVVGVRTPGYEACSASSLSAAVGRGGRKGAGRERAGERMRRLWFIKRNHHTAERWDFIFFQGIIYQNNGEREWSGMSNNGLPGSLLTMVIISQLKSTGSRPIKDTSVLLFTIQLNLFLKKNMEANLFRYAS